MLSLWPASKWCIYASSPSFCLSMSLCLMVKAPFEKQAREEHKLINIPFLKSNTYLQSCGFSQCLDVNPSLCCRPQVHHDRSAILRKHHIAWLQVSVTQSRSTISTHAWDTVCRHGAKCITQSTPLRREAYQYVLMNRPSACVIVGGRGWGKHELFINNCQSMD